MYKTFVKFVMAAAGLFCLSACNLDMYGTYSFQHGGRYHVLEGNTETTGKAIQEYFESIVDFDNNETFTGTSYEATQYGSDLFDKTLEKIDEDYLMSLLKVEVDEKGDTTDREWVQYSLVMTGDDAYMTIGYYTWVAGYENESGQASGDPESGSVQNL